jgi:hypothetical protein
MVTCGVGPRVPPRAHAFTFGNYRRRRSISAHTPEIEDIAP